MSWASIIQKGLSANSKTLSRGGITSVPNCENRSEMANFPDYGSDYIHNRVRYRSVCKRSISESNDFQQVKRFLIKFRGHNQNANSINKHSLDRILEDVQLLLNRPREYPPQASKPVSEHTNRYFEAPAANHLFVGREALLEKVSTAFVASDSSTQSEHESEQPPTTRARLQQRFVIYGLSGSGKTEFCIKFCHRNQRQ